MTRIKWPECVRIALQASPSLADVPADDGIVYDNRPHHVSPDYLGQLERATAEGVPVKGHFLWRPPDNFEWADGSYPLPYPLCRRHYPEPERPSSAPGSTRP